ILNNEARVWLELSRHPNIVSLYEIKSASPSRLILVLEAVLPGPGGRTTLQEWIEANAVDLQLALRFFSQLCHALFHCQGLRQGFVHGDLKPNNLLIDVGYMLKVTDFGLARWARLGAPSVGNRRYLAPECQKGHMLTEKSDVYAAGLILSEML